MTKSKLRKLLQIFNNSYYGADSSRCGTGVLGNRTSQGWGIPKQSCENAGGVISQIKENPPSIIIADENQIKRNPKFLDETKFATTQINGETTNLLDPWGNPYMYWYKWDDNPNLYEMFGYHLYSTGAGGKTANNTIKTKINANTGLIADDFRDTANRAGIIFAGE